MHTFHDLLLPAQTKAPLLGVWGNSLSWRRPLRRRGTGQPGTPRPRTHSVMLAFGIVVLLRGVSTCPVSNESQIHVIQKNLLCHTPEFGYSL